MHGRLLDSRRGSPCRPPRLDQAARARGRARPRLRRGRSRPRDHRDRRPHRQGRRAGAALRAPEGLRSTRCWSTSSAPSGACASPSARQPRRRRRDGSRRSRDAAAAGSRREGQGPREAEVDRRLDAEDGPTAACQEIVLEGDDIDLDLLPIQRCWPGDPAPFITLPAVITSDPHTGTRNVGMYRMQKIDRAHDLHALADAQGRADGLPRVRRAARGRRRARARPGDGVLGLGAAAEAHRRVHARRLPARRAGRARPGEDGRPRGAGQRGDRARGLRRDGRRGGSKGRSATTPATTRPPSRSPSST